MKIAKQSKASLKNDWSRIYRSMRKPALVFDTRNCLDAAALRKHGFTVLNIGK